MRVPAWIRGFSAVVSRHQGLFARLGNLESKVLSDRLAEVRIEQPIYISGLARSGSTLLLEMLHEHPATASHLYRDFPPVFTPYAWNSFLNYAGERPGEPAERAHQDGIRVNSRSPEAMEEMVWMRFFPEAHDPEHSSVLGPEVSNPTFERFYANHLKKILLMRGGSRYLCKGNYNLPRLEYLHALFPDARFVVPIREPARHVASLVRQHTMFCEAAREIPAVTAHLRRVGHFEFGPERRPINIDGEARRILEHWQANEDALGYAEMWRAVYGHLRRMLAENEALADAVRVVRYEELCADPDSEVAALLDHVNLRCNPIFLAALAGRITPVGSRPLDLDGDTAEKVREITRDVAEGFGYR